MGPGIRISLVFFSFLMDCGWSASYESLGGDSLPPLYPLMFHCLCFHRAVGRLCYCKSRLPVFRCRLLRAVLGPLRLSDAFSTLLRYDNTNC